MKLLSGKWLLALVFTALLSFDCTAYFSSVSLTDSLPAKSAGEYKGYRLHLTSLQLLRKKDREFKVRFTLINTGRKNVTLGKDAGPADEVIILFDPSSVAANLIAHQEEIEEALRLQPVSIVVGQIKEDLELSFTAKNESPPAIITSNESQEEDADRSEEVSLLEAFIPKGGEGEGEVQVQGEVQGEGEDVEEGVDVEKVQVQVQEEDQDKVQVQVQDVEEVQGEGEDVEEGKVEEEEEGYIPYLDKDNCSDLVLSSIRMVKKTKKHLTLEYTVVNQGKGPAALFGSSGSKEDNVAIRANISGSTRLSRGAIVIGGDYISGGLKEQNGQLMPGQSYTGTIKLETYKMTRFTPNIILELDAYNLLIECDETNNRNHITVD